MFEQDSEMISELGRHRVRDHELETARDIYELAAFIATETFELETNLELVLDIEGKSEYTFDVLMRTKPR